MPAHSTARQSPHGVQTPYRYHRLAFLPELPGGKRPKYCILNGLGRFIGGQGYHRESGFPFNGGHEY